MQNSKKPRGVGISSIRKSDVMPMLARYHIDPDEYYPGGVLPDWAIREFITIDNFVDYDECPKGVISYGLSSGGYDLRVGTEFHVFNNVHAATVDPRNLSTDAFKTINIRREHKWQLHNDAYSCAVCDYPAKIGDDVTYVSCDCKVKPEDNFITIPPNSFALACSMERLEIPRNVMCLCLGKSTYARAGVNMNFTPFEPGWRGIVTIEIINGSTLPVKIYANQGIAQSIFSLMLAPPQRSYAEKSNSKYQDQTGITLPTVK